MQRTILVAVLLAILGLGFVLGGVGSPPQRASAATTSFSSSSAEPCKNVATIIGSGQILKELVGVEVGRTGPHLYLAAWCRATVQGTVKAIERPIPNGDYHVLIEPDPSKTELAGQRQDLRQGCAVAASALNHHALSPEDFHDGDLLLLEINPGSPVPVQTVGAKISGWGAWVYDNDSADLQATLDGKLLGPKRGHHCEVHPFIQ